jgi:thiol-disulfide isomerase/thioredoxin
MMYLATGTHAQQISIKIGRVENGHLTKILISDANSIGSHITRNKNSFYDSFLITSAGSGKYSIHKNFKPGFYLIELAHIYREGQDNREEIKGSSFVFINDTINLELFFDNPDDMFPRLEKCNDATNRILSSFLQKKMTFNRKRCKYSELEIMRVLMAEFETVDNEYVKLFIANELAYLEFSTDLTYFYETIAANYTIDFSSRFRETILYRNFISEYHESMSRIELSMLNEIELLDTDSITVTNNLQSKTAILYFWASWCQPSRKDNITETPLLKAKIADLPVRVISISLDDDFYKWKKATIQDNIVWENYIIKGPVLAMLRQKLKLNQLPRVFVLKKNLEPISLDCSIATIENILTSIDDTIDNN